MGLWLLMMGLMGLLVLVHEGGVHLQRCRRGRQVGRHVDLRLGIRRRHGWSLAEAVGCKVSDT